MPPRPVSSPFDPHIEVEEGNANSGEACADVYYVSIAQNAYRAGDSSPGAPRDRVLIARVTEGLLRTFPIRIRREADDYLRPKYNTVTTISFTGGRFGWDLPQEEEDFVGLLVSFRQACLTNAAAGLRDRGAGRGVTTPARDGA